MVQRRSFDQQHLRRAMIIAENDFDAIGKRAQAAKWEIRRLRKCAGPMQHVDVEDFVFAK
jgi:hypothetical protein